VWSLLGYNPGLKGKFYVQYWGFMGLRNPENLVNSRLYLEAILERISAMHAKTLL
jgi:hypothetical protein